MTPARPTGRAPKTKARRGQSALRRWSLWLHGWLGITVGAWLALVGLTGSVLIWRPEAEPRLEAQARQVLAPPPGAAQVPLQSVFETVRGAYPKHKIDRVSVSRGASLAHEVRLRGDDQISVFVDPWRGRIVGQQAYRSDFFGTVDGLHVRLLSGEVGHTLVGAGGVVLLAMALSGLWLWWPRAGQWRRAFVPRLSTNWRGRNYELHRVTGAVVCLIFIAEAATGMALVWAEPTRALLARVTGEKPQKKPEKASVGALQPLDTYAQSARATFPGAQISRITLPKKKGAPLVVRLQQPGELNPAGNSSVFFDPPTAKVLQVEDSRRADATTRAMNLRYPIHAGLWGGLAVRVFYTLLGLTLPAFYASGLVLWWNKRRQKKRAHDASPRLPQRAEAPATHA